MDTKSESNPLIPTGKESKKRRRKGKTRKQATTKQDFSRMKSGTLCKVIRNYKHSHIDLSSFPFKEGSILTLLSLLIALQSKKSRIKSVKLDELPDSFADDADQLKTRLAKNTTLSKIEIMGTPNQTTVLAFVMGSINAEKHFEVIVDISRCNIQQEINNSFGLIKALQAKNTSVLEKQETPDSDVASSDDDAQSLSPPITPRSSKEDSDDSTDLTGANNPPSSSQCSSEPENSTEESDFLVHSSEDDAPPPQRQRPTCDGVHFVENGYKKEYAGTSVVFGGLFKSSQGRLTGERKLFANTHKGKNFPDLTAILKGKRLPFANTLRATGVYKQTYFPHHECTAHPSGQADDNMSKPLL